MKTEGEKSGWVFGISWIAATAFGMCLGFMGGFFLGTFAYNLLGEAATAVVFVTTLGTGIGLMQWIVLRPHIRKAGWWVLTNIAGTLGLIKTATSRSIYQADCLSPILIGTGLVALCGAVTGMLQWLILRNRLDRAGWWIPACAVSWGVCLPILNGGLFGTGNPPTILSMITGFAVLGVITGVTMIWLLRQPVTENLDGFP